MRKLYRLKLFIIATLGLAATACGSDHDGDPDVDDISKRTILVYAVASNNLYSNLIDDKNEMLEATECIDLSGLNLLVYEVTNYGGAKLSEVVRNSEGKCVFEEIKPYDRVQYSTDPERIRAVINDMVELRRAESYGLVLWSHGTGIDVTTSTHPSVSTKSASSSADGFVSVELKPVGSFGSDNNPDGNSRYYDEINVDELADAIPDNLFDFIWFDACYMAGIETIYQMRDKCRYYVGYPTEVFTPGMPYHLTMPYLLRETPDLVEAAKAFFNYYSEHSSASLRVATVAVTDMQGLESVADFCKDVYSSGNVASSNRLQCYTRGSIGPFYDFGQYTRQLAAKNSSSPDMKDFENAMDKFVVWSATTDKDFNFRTINKENLSVISCWLFNPTSSTDKAKYYLSLDWYKRVYPQM